MGIGIDEAHLDLAKVAASFLHERGALAQHRALLDSPGEELPGLWDDLAELGWLGLTSLRRSRPTPWRADPRVAP